MDECQVNIIKKTTLYIQFSTLGKMAICKLYLGARYTLNKFKLIDL